MRMLSSADAHRRVEVREKDTLHEVRLMHEVRMIHEVGEEMRLRDVGKYEEVRLKPRRAGQSQARCPREAAHRDSESKKHAS